MQGTHIENPFLQTIQNLFHTNKLVLTGRFHELSPEQAQQVGEFLRQIYQEEAMGYPHTGPLFHEEAALYAAKLLFYAAQLVPHRGHKAEALNRFFPTYPQPKSAAAMLSADLCLRFMPAILQYLEQIDLEDELIPILRNFLAEWHYSGLLYDSLGETSVDWAPILANECLKRLYVDRVIEKKRIHLAEREELKPLVLSALGNYTNKFWKEFNLKK